MKSHWVTAFLTFRAKARSQRQRPSAWHARNERHVSTQSSAPTLITAVRCDARVSNRSSPGTLERGISDGQGYVSPHCDPQLFQSNQCRVGGKTSETVHARPLRVRPGQTSILSPEVGRVPSTPTTVHTKQDEADKGPGSPPRRAIRDRPISRVRKQRDSWLTFPPCQ